MCRFDQTHECGGTTTGSAGSMEAQGALAEWHRCEASHGLRYTTFTDDGDCKAHEAIKQAKPSGQPPMVKEEWLGHVQKIVGTRLLALKKCPSTTELSDGKTIGGPGRLPDCPRSMCCSFILTGQFGSTLETC